MVSVDRSHVKTKPSRFLATAELVLKAWATVLAEVWKTSWSMESRGEFSPCSKMLNDGELNYPGSLISKLFLSSPLLIIDLSCSPASAGGSDTPPLRSGYCPVTYTCYTHNPDKNRSHSRAQAARDTLDT